MELQTFGFSPYVYDDVNEICSILLREGYWAIETFYDDYLLTRKSESGSYEVLDLCKALCKALKQNEAWICVAEHLTNTCTAPNNFNDWLKYAQQFGIVELTSEIMDRLGSRREWFAENRFIIDGEEACLASPIYHMSYGIENIAPNLCI